MDWTVSAALALYAALISLLGAGLAVYDKIAAKALPRHRIPENTLLGVAMLGGAAAMYIVMLLIRHKTRHKKFMTGLPVIIGVHVILLFCYFLLR